MNSENSRTSEYHVLVVKLADKLDLRRGKTSIVLSNLSIYYTWKNIKSSYKNNNFKISTPTWSDTFILNDGSYSVSDIQDYFEYILKKHGETVDDPSIRIYVNKTENRITVNNTAAADADANKTNKKVIFKNSAPFSNCISEINNTQVDNAYEKTSGSLWQYCKDIPAVGNNNAIVDYTENNLTDSFNFKIKMTGQNEDDEQRMLKLWYF